MTSILFLCTSNTSVSVIAQAALRSIRPDLEVSTAGTLNSGRMPINGRIRAALDTVGLQWPSHISRQADVAMLDAADVVIGLAAQHVLWVRRTHPAASPRTSTLRHLADSLTAGPDPLADRIAALGLDQVGFDTTDDVVDPLGGEVEEFIDVADVIVWLVERLGPAL